MRQIIRFVYEIIAITTVVFVEHARSVDVHDYFENDLRKSIKFGEILNVRLLNKWAQWS